MDVKICGLSREEDVEEVARAGARYAGFVFFEPSPRNVSLETARRLALKAPLGLCKVALVVNADNATLDSITEQVPIDMLQLHGAETPERVAEVKARYGLPVMKAIGISTAEDLGQIDVYSKVADQLLIDTKPPKGADRPGGNGLAFDWGLLKGRRWAVPWMLAGGLTQDNVLSAIAQTNAKQIDLSSAVEREKGVKDPELIRSFMAVALS